MFSLKVIKIKIKMIMKENVFKVISMRRVLFLGKGKEKLKLTEKVVSVSSFKI
jgi:hypothetical protein